MAAAVGSNTFGLDANLYTRGQGEVDRGASMVEKHKEKLQQKRKKLMEDEELRQAARAKAEAESASSSGSDSHASDTSDSPDDERRKKKKHSKRRSSDKHKKRGSKETKKKKKKRERAGEDSKAKPLTHSTEFGKYGIIRETDMAAKRSEFILWAMDIKHMDVELLNKNEERELFRDYMEDYNTGTLPHRKYYNIEAYEKYKAAKRATRDGERAEKRPKVSVQDDEAEVRRQRAEERARLQEQRLREAYNELKYTEKAKDMKEQEMLRLQMQIAYKTGDITKAHQLQERLKPDDLKAKTDPSKN